MVNPFFLQPFSVFSFAIATNITVNLLKWFKLILCCLQPQKHVTWHVKPRWSFIHVAIHRKRYSLFILSLLMHKVDEETLLIKFSVVVGLTVILCKVNPFYFSKRPLLAPWYSSSSAGLLIQLNTDVKEPLTVNPSCKLFHISQSMLNV